MIYDVKFFDHGGHIFSTATLSADDDRQAIELARQRFQCGIGHSYEIWQADRLVHGELLNPSRSAHDGGLARFHGTLVRHCIEQALAGSDLQQRRLLMIFAEKLLGYSPGVRNSDSDHYTLVLSGAQGRVIADLELPVATHEEAFAVASVLADACSDFCTRFELWRGQTLQGSATGPFSRPAMEQLSEQSRAIVLEREIRLHETCKTIAESDRLLRKLNAWFGARATAAA